MESDYSGYDPYDGAWSDYTLINGRKYTRLLSTYLNKFSPLNLRPLLKIKKSIQNQSLAFIGRAMLSFPDVYLSEINKISDHLAVDSLIGKHGYHYWDAHAFPIQMRNSYRPVGKTDIIGDEAVGRFFLDLYRIDLQPQYKEICNNVAVSFIDRHLKNYQSKYFFKYTPSTPITDWCYNASVIVGAFVASITREFNLDFGNAYIDQTFRDVIGQQKPDGQGIYRYPKKYPVNIHNQAQGIITFTRAAAFGFGDHYLDFARTIAEWTIKNMQDLDGHFYYLKYPLFTNKIPYIRWSDAAMAYALSVYLKNK